MTIIHSGYAGFIIAAWLKSWVLSFSITFPSELLILPKVVYYLSRMIK
ncbi:DUF2798 domain-containing protein [Vibrio astriarenae]